MGSEPPEPELPGFWSAMEDMSFGWAEAEGLAVAVGAVVGWAELWVGCEEEVGSWALAKEAERRSRSTLGLVNAERVMVKVGECGGMWRLRVQRQRLTGNVRRVNDLHT